MHIDVGNNFHSNSNRSLKTAKDRTLFAISIFLLLFASIIFRLAHVMILKQIEITNDNANCSIPTVVMRADIVDKNDTIIATSLPTVSIYACPHEIIDPNEAASKLCKVFNDIDQKILYARLISKKKFFWIRRNLSPAQEQHVLNQGIPGVHFLKTEHRVYPDKNLISHIIGGTDIDNIGIAGIEKVFDEALSSSTEPLRLTIDMKIQHAVHDELTKSITEFSAIAGSAIVMEIKTGEIIAMVSLPDFDPNKNMNPLSKEKFNMATSSAIEPGSSAKIFNTAMALESGKITPFTQFDARFPLKIGRFTVHDFKGKGTFLSVEEILKFSSNIGSAKIALDVGIPYQKSFYKTIGITDHISCELPESQKPLLPKHWTEASAITISYGHGFALSPLHMITVFAGMLNNGILNKPTLIKRDIQLPGNRIISQNTAKKIYALLRINVLEGTNKLANVPGYFVGGKTGTAEKQKGGRYLKNANYTTFTGAFPMTDPKYAIYIVLDEPKATEKTHGYATAGWNSAPTFARIVERIGPMLGILITQEEEPDWKEKLRRLQ